MDGERGAWLAAAERSPAIRFRPIHLLFTGPMILVLAVPYFVEGHRAAALVSTAVGGSTLAYGLSTLRKVRFLAFWSVALVVLSAFTAGALVGKLAGLW